MLVFCVFIIVGFTVLLDSKRRLTVIGCCGSDLIEKVLLFIMNTVGLGLGKSVVDLSNGVVVIERNFCKEASPICKGLIRFLLRVEEFFIAGMIIVLDSEDEVRIREDVKSILTKLNS
jgi:hypothetical protein